jgi:hypothetical protein
VKTISIFFCLVSALLTLLFCGISRDPLTYEYSIFLKQEPTFQIFYYPLERGQEFVDRLWFIPAILIQLTLTFLSFSIKTRINTKPKYLIMHFLVTILPSYVITRIFLFSDEAIEIILMSVLLLVTNLGTLKITPLKRKPQQMH